MQAQSWLQVISTWISKDNHIFIDGEYQINITYLTADILFSKWEPEFTGFQCNTFLRILCPYQHVLKSNTDIYYT